MLSTRHVLHVLLEIASNKRSGAHLQVVWQHEAQLHHLVLHPPTAVWPIQDVKQQVQHRHNLLRRHQVIDQAPVASMWLGGDDCAEVPEHAEVASNVRPRLDAAQAACDEVRQGGREGVELQIQLALSNGELDAAVCMLRSPMHSLR